MIPNRMSGCFISTSYLRLRTYRGGGSVADCSCIISLQSLPLSLMILRLRKTFLVSFQCHRCATTGSSRVRRRWRVEAASGSVAAMGGWSGRSSYRTRKSEGRSDSASVSLSDNSVLMGGVTGTSDVVSSNTPSRPGNTRCCIQ